MLRIPIFVALLASLTTAELLGQRSLITARAVLPPRALIGRQNQFSCAQATDTVCPDGSGCCPGGAACFSSGGIGLCSVLCDAAQPTCVFNAVTACCPVGDTCGGSLCIPATGVMGPGPSVTSAASTSLLVASSSSSISSKIAVSSSNIVASSSSTKSTTAPVAIVSSVTTKTTVVAPTGLLNTNTFVLGGNATRTGTSKPAMATVAAADSLKPWNSILKLAGLAALGFAF